MAGGAAGIRGIRGWLGIAGALLAAVGPLGAQQGALRAEVERVVAGVAAASDRDALEREERTLKARAGGDSAGEAFRRIHLGVVRLRLNELGRGAGAPTGDFARASELRPGWVYAWYGRGLAKRAEGDWLAADRLNLGMRVGFGAYEEAARRFRQALAIEPDFAPALRGLAATVALLRDTQQVRRVLLPALAAADQALGDSLVLLALVEAERTHGDPHAALAAAHRLQALTGPSARSLRQLAWAGFLAGDPGAEAVYYEGAGRDDSLGVALYREDLALIADSATLAAFDAEPPSGRAAWLRAFWLARDRQALRAPGERLAEHYRRLTEAERRFGLEVNRRFHHAWDSYRSGSLRFDDRGIIYIRHGEPDAVASAVTFGLPPNLTWRYRRADGDLLLHFAANPGSYELGTGGDRHDYRLIPSLWAVSMQDARGSSAPLDALLETRCPLYAPYCKVNSAGRLGRRQIRVDERDFSEGSVEAAVVTDGHELRFPRLLTGDAALFAVGQEAGRPMVHAAWQLLLLRPPGADSTMVFRTRARVRFALLDSAGTAVGWVDTTVALVALAGRDTVIVPGRVAVAVPPGSWRYRLALQTDDSTGRVFPTDSVSPKPADGRALGVSDLVLGRRDVSIPWAAAPGDTAFFTPGARWRQGDELEVYHEVYGLRAGEAYRAALVIRRGKRAVLSLGWTGVGTGDVTRVARSLDLAALRPGDYRLEVEVTSAAGSTARSSRRLGVRARD